MARIPHARQLGLEAGDAQLTRGVVNVPVVNTSGEQAAARALADAGKAVSAFGQQLVKAETDRKIVQADRKTREDLDLEYRRIAEDASIKPEEFENRYREATTKVIASNSELVPPGGRDLWKQRAMDWQSDGVIRTRSLQRERQLETESAKLIEEGAEVERMLADPGLDEAVVNETASKYLGLIERQEASGIVTKDRAAEQRAKLANAVQKSTQNRRTYEIDGLLQANDYKSAKAHLYDHRTEIDGETFRKIEAVITNKQNGFEAQVDADAMWEKGGGYQGALALARKEPDIARRQEIEKNLATRVSQERAANEAQQDVHVDQLWDHVRKGGTVESAPVSLMAKFDDPVRFASIRVYQDARDKEDGMSSAEKAAAKLQSTMIRNGIEVLAMQDPQAFLAGPDQWPTYYRTVYQSMTPEDLIALEDKRQKMLVGGTSADAAQTVYTDLMAEARRVVPSAWWTNKDGAKSPKEFELESRLYEVARMIAKERGGQKITPDDAKVAVLRVLGQPFSEGADEAWNPKDWKVAAVAADQFAQVSEIARRDPETWKDVWQTLKRRNGGKDPSAVEALAMYNAVVPD